MGSLAAACALVGAASVAVAYSVAGHTWATSTVAYSINTANSQGLPAAELIAAIQNAGAQWHDQSSANIALVYSGTSNKNTTEFDGSNNVFFRDDTSQFGAETLWWYDGTGSLVDFDIVAHEGSYTFVIPGAPCSGGVFVDDIMVHEFGHALGLGHSDVPGATMAPSAGYCDTSQMVLEPDDIAGIEFLYPGAPSSSQATTTGNGGAAATTVGAGATTSATTSATQSGSASSGEETTVVSASASAATSGAGGGASASSAGTGASASGTGGPGAGSGGEGLSPYGAGPNDEDSSAVEGACGCETVGHRPDTGSLGALLLVVSIALRRRRARRVVLMTTLRERLFFGPVMP
jgi:hypothetical protein